MKKIFIHLPAYREPELIPTIKDAIAKAFNSERLVFGICRQYHPEDTFDNLEDYRHDSRFKIVDILYTEAKGLPYARGVINSLITDEDYILQLDAHHRFVQNWDKILIQMLQTLKKEYPKPILAGYLPTYNPFNEFEKTEVPFQQDFVCFYPFGTIFIRPSELVGWRSLKKPVPSRFLSGHFCFAEIGWAKEIKHDPDLYFAGEEINLTVRSYTHGYDFFHPHKVVIWHATMREERSGKLLWDDQHKRGDISFWVHQDAGRAKIRQLFGTEDNGFDLTGFDLGTTRSLRDYESYAGVRFLERLVHINTLENYRPPVNDSNLDNYRFSFYQLVQINKKDFPHRDYQFWIIAFDDSNGQGVWREDLGEREVQEILDSPGQWYDRECYFTIDKVPSRYVIWAYRKNFGWAERVEVPVEYKNAEKYTRHG